MIEVICPYCKHPAELVGGDVIYPHRRDLRMLKFWRCRDCDAWVGCHKPGAWVADARIKSDGTVPLGRLANAELRREKSRAHAAFDPLWQSGFSFKSRRAAYAALAESLGIPLHDCHIGMFDVDGCRAVVRFSEAIEVRDDRPL